jgi:cysteine desulfuration protein SufE
MLPSFDEIIANFEFLDDWDERYRYVIELGRMMEPLPDAARTEANKVRGCASQVWLETRTEPSENGPVFRMRGESDAHIVRGLIALLIALYSGHSPRDVLSADATKIFRDLGLSEHLTPQRSNGVRAMVDRIRSDAQAAALA